MKKNYFAVVIGMILLASSLLACGNDNETADVDENGFDAVVKVDESRFVFTTTDIDGNAVGIEDYSDAKLIMVNFWEPWCGPCVGEMPDLEKIYEEYKDDGFVILGVYSTIDMEEETREVLTSIGTSYPILKYDDSMEAFMPEYVPTTYFIDGDGNLLSDEAMIGSNSYEAWKEIIEEYMNR